MRLLIIQRSLVNEQKIGRSKTNFDDRSSSRRNDLTLSDGHPYNENIISNGTDALFDPATQDGYMPGQLRSTKRKKKKGLSQSL